MEYPLGCADSDCVHNFVFVAIKGWFKNAEMSVWTYVVGIVLFVLIAIQGIMISGATKIISLSDYYEQELTDIVNQASQNSNKELSLGSVLESLVTGGVDGAVNNVIGGILGGNPDHEVSGPESTAIVEQLVSQYPILSNYFDYGVFKGYTVSELPHAIACEIEDYMKWYIFRRLMWCLGFVVVAAVIVIWTINKQWERRLSPSTRRPSGHTAGSFGRNSRLGHASGNRSRYSRYRH